MDKYDIQDEMDEIATRHIGDACYFELDDLPEPDRSRWLALESRMKELEGKKYV